MSLPHGEGDGGRESAASQGNELVSSSSSIAPPPSSSSSSSRPHRLLPPLSLPRHLHLSLPSPRGLISAVSGAGDAARHQAHLALRTADFWRRATGIYLAYKGRQAQEAALTSPALALAAPLLPGGRGSAARPWDRERLEEELWKPHHEWAGKEMYELAVSVRGFYLKVGQFFAARSEFVPVQICRRLALLHDSVPPMPAAMARKVIEAELGGAPLGDVFEWIDLEKPLGAASVAQVHKARLRGDPSSANKARGGKRAAVLRWLARSRLNPFRGRVLERDRRLAPPRPDVPLLVPSWEKKKKSGGGGEEEEKDAGKSGGKNKGVLSGLGGLLLSRAESEERKEREKAAAARAAAAVAAARAASAAGDPSSSSSASSLDPDVAPDGLVAVKVQYPGAAALMAHDIRHVRVWARFLSKTEIAFDLVSAVDELDAQVALEFDFEREARVMDAIAGHLDAALNNESGGGSGKNKRKGGRRLLWWKRRSPPANVVVPRSVPGLVTRRVLTMGFVDGVPLTKLEGHVSRLKLPKRLKVAASRRILASVASAYGAMILGEGLFQADSHPGNVMVLGKSGLARGSGRVALLDYGQSKQLPERERVAFAALLLALAPGFRRADERAIAERLRELGLRFSKDDPPTLKKMAYAMFDTRCSYRVDPFAPDAPIKSVAIETFPPDVFFVLRVIQMLRGLAGAMGVNDFSIVEQWLPRAKAAVAEGPRLEEGEAGVRPPCVTWPTERFDAAVLAMRERERERQKGEEERVLLISEGGAGEAVREAQSGGAAAAPAAAVRAVSAAPAVPAAAPLAPSANALPLRAPSPSPPPQPTTGRPAPPPPPPPPIPHAPPSSSSSTAASHATAAIIKPSQVTPAVPSAVAYSAEVVGAAPAHLRELVASDERREREEEEQGSASNKAASAGALSSALASSASSSSTKTPKSSSVPSTLAAARAPSAETAISSSSGKESSSTKAMRVSFRAVPALAFVAVEKEGEKEERKEVGAAVSATKA